MRSRVEMGSRIEKGKRINWLLRPNFLLLLNPHKITFGSMFSAFLTQFIKS